MIIVENIYIKGQARISVHSGNSGWKVLKDGIQRDVSIDFPGEEVNYTEVEPGEAEEIVNILLGGES